MPPAHARTEKYTEITRREQVLFFLSGVFITLNQISLILVQDRDIFALWIVGVWAGCAAGVHFLANRRLPARDPFLLPAAFFLSGWSLNLIDRLQPNFADRQAGWLVFSSVTLGLLTFLPADLNWLHRYRYTWLFIGLALLFTTILIGVNPSGAFGPRLWLDFGRLFYQPSELLKILLVAFIASYLGDHWITLRHEIVQVGRWRLPSPAFFAPILLMWGLCVVILVWQRDLGTATLFFVVFMLMLYLASGQVLLLIGGSALLIIAGIVAYQLFDVVALRVDIWLNPWREPDGRAFQLVQSLMAVSAGGIFGQGIGQGIPTFIPVVHSDFIFSALAEEWGLIGVIALLAMLALIVIRAFRVAQYNQHRPTIALFAAGLGLLIATQSMLIMGGTIRLLPLTGVTLPFVSYGGSSLVTSYIIIGFLLILSGDIAHDEP